MGVRQMSRTQHPVSIVVYFHVIGAVAMALILPFGGVTPDWIGFAALSGVELAGDAGHGQSCRGCKRPFHRLLGNRAPPAGGKRTLSVQRSTLPEDCYRQTPNGDVIKQNHDGKRNSRLPEQGISYVTSPR